MSALGHFRPIQCSFGMPIIRQEGDIKTAGAYRDMR
jgi:hypothetical protein